MELKIFGDKLKTLRMDKGLSQSNFAKLLKTSQGYIGEVERGEKKPGLDLLVNLRKELFIDLNNFLADDLQMIVAKNILDYKYSESIDYHKTLDKLETLINELNNVVKEAKYPKRKNS
jgi:transcriptional regulator with XRE-family HTH domain